ncbi:uncharacterized protein LOC112591915 [Melanaphis sacchari]|uniref:uncharacterized protein LOC112591915 n=1 Tax=Melanaphis sacchari TaxID=742174 RepID=UPI000DC151E1|nr:uncharacterized protein LOC112591915 [Melanaphis sacchari]
MWVVIYHTNKIWNCLSITWYGFTSFGFGSKHILNHWRKLYIKAFSKSLTPVNNRDAKVSDHRQALITFLVVLMFKIYDVLLTTLYFSICGQMHMIRFAFESVRYKSIPNPNFPIGAESEKESEYFLRNIT